MEGNPGALLSGWGFKPNSSSVKLTLRFLRVWQKRMAENRQITHGENNNDEDLSGELCTIKLREKDPEIVFTVSSDLYEIKKLIKKDSSKKPSEQTDSGHRFKKNKLNTLAKKLIKQETSKKPSVQIGSIDASLSGVIGMADTIDRPPGATAEGVYANTGAYATGSENKPGKRLPKAGAYAEAGVGRARAEFSVFEAEAKGPNASASAEASTALTAGAIARAEIGSVSANAGPIGVKLGLGVDTGVSVGLDGLEVKVLGIGFTIGPRTSISLLGSEVSCSIM